MKFSHPQYGSVEGEPSFVTLFANSVREHEAAQEQWIAQLRRDGVAAAHPDDGWVNREANSIHLCYPHFQDATICPGSRIAIGTPEAYRLVTVTAITTSQLGLTRYHFEAQP